MILEWQQTTHYWALNSYPGNGAAKSYLLFLDGPPYRWGRLLFNMPLNYHTLHTATIDEAKVCLEVIARMNA